MSSRNETKAEKERQKQIQDKCQSVLTELLRDDDNKYCVDCDAKGPRWASWNLGVFLCIRCAGIHRNLGVHISKVKSVNLDSWKPEQVVSLQQMGNSRARAVYEATLPDSWRRPQTDSSLETFIRAKYQHKRYIAKEWVQPAMPKVDWEKELDEETERQKKKKKEKQQQQISSALPPVKKVDVRVPALPKPTSSPKSTRATSAVPVEEPSKSSGADLLGLSLSANNASSNENGNDVFSSFLSAPVAPDITNLPAPEPVLVEDSKGRSAEEDSFFNQPSTATSSGDSKKTLSKDSILALYSSNSTPAPQPTMFHTPGMYPPNQSMGFPPTSNMGFPAAPSAGFPSVPNASFPTLPNTGFPPVANSGFPTVPSSGFQSGFLPQMGGFPPMTGPTAFSNGVQPAAPGPNPFFGMSAGMTVPQGFPIQLPQQMGGLTLSGGPIAAPANGVFPTMAAPLPVKAVMNPNLGQTFTTHLWQ